METALGICLGLGLAAACGFRVFVPMFLMGLAAAAGRLELADRFGWIGTWPAVTAFGVATLAETAAFYVPWLDNLLDTLASPAAVVAGIVATAACVTDADPLVQWSAAMIGGAGVAGTVQSSTVAARATSSVTTGGLANFVISTVELVGSLLMTLLVLLAPILAALVALALAVAAVRFVLRSRRKAVVAR